MKIRNKTRDLLKDYATYGERYTSLIDIKSLRIGVVTELESPQYLEASIKWCYSTSTEIVHRFDNSEEGFIAACEWLDSMRIKFAEELL